MWGNWGLCHAFFGWAGGGMLGGVLGVLLIGALITGLAILGLWLWRRAEGSGRRAFADQPSSLEVLRVRYARGEISRNDFLRMSEELYGANPAHRE